MVINTTTLVSDLSFLQKGYTYGVNDSGPWQRFKRRGNNYDVESWYNILLNAGWICTVTREVVNSTTNNGISEIEASCGWAFPWIYGTETPENIWELDPEDEQKDLLSADYPFGSVNLNNAGSQKTKNALKKIVADDGALWATAATTSTYGQVTMTSGLIYTFDGGLAGVDTAEYVGLPIADYDSAYSLYLLITAGVEAFPFEATKIQHSMLTSNLYAIQASYNNMGRIISTASMYSIEGVPSTLLFAIPTTPTPSQLIETVGDLQYGWRKIRPAVSRLSRMKWRLTQNYQFGLWPVKLFGNVL